jgi:uncharacterized protein YceK
MNSTRIAVLVASFALSLSGCGTVANLKTGEPELYGGVQHDWQLLQTPQQQPSGIGIRNLGPLVLFVDMPLCFVADTLTLPVAIVEWHRSEERKDGSDRAGTGNAVVPAAFQPSPGDANTPGALRVEPSAAGSW